MATREDGALVVQLAQLAESMGVRPAVRKLLSDGFDPDTATLDDDAVNVVCNFSETVGTLTKAGVLDADLVLDWLWVSGPWARVAPAVRKAREKFGVPRLYENFEALAAQQQ